MKRILQTKFRRRLRPRARQGVSATEFVIVLPLLVALGLGAVDFGRFGFVAIVLENAARVGAERGASHSFTSYTSADWKADVLKWSQRELADIKTGWLKNLNITVTTVANADNLNQVTVAIDATLIPLIDWPIYSGSLNIHRQITMGQFR